MFRKLTASLALVLLLAGCTAPQDPYVDTVIETVSKTSFKPTGQMASGCVGVNLFCMQPMYEPIFFAPESVEPKIACTDLVNLAKKLGLEAYSTPGAMAYRVPNDSAVLINFCAQALDTPLTNSDGSTIYNGIVLYDEGSKDGFGKVYSVSRGPSEFGEGYSLIISFSRDSTRIGKISFGTEPPKLMTQADLDAANEASTIASETMKVANQLLGKSEAEAIESIEANGYSWVIIDRDGVEQKFDQTYDPRRILLTTRDGLIYDAIAG